MTRKATDETWTYELSDEEINMLIQAVEDHLEYLREWGAKDYTVTLAQNLSYQYQALLDKLVEGGTQ
jgi:hypothetical protein